ncbi:hypothetical protein CDAR_525051 [Caerostris darwini]|uniref:Uncharacterized protein n=1 Tax=Caerostris darwini TaxID=1538125 RepID=A0AAV4R035_9ARAC|nr:hypothetical protein CDAR_525051 [Caerostris darwini]
MSEPTSLAQSVEAPEYLPLLIGRAHTDTKKKAILRKSSNELRSGRSEEPGSECLIRLVRTKLSERDRLVPSPGRHFTGLSFASQARRRKITVQHKLLSAETTTSCMDIYRGIPQTDPLADNVLE